MTQPRKSSRAIAAIALGALVFGGGLAAAGSSSGPRISDRDRLTPKRQSQISRDGLTATAKPALRLNDAAVNLLSGDFDKARSSYNTALGLARTPAEKESAAIDWINLLSQTSRVNAGDPRLQSVVAAEYRKLLETSSGSARRLAGNNLGFKLLQDGQNTEALRVLNIVKADYGALQDGPAKAGFFYNLGLAAERNGDIQVALSHYKTSADADPNFRPAVRAVLRNLGTLPAHAETRSKTYTWIGTALERRDYEAARRALEAYFSRPDRRPYLTDSQTVRLLLVYLTGAGLTPKEYTAWQEKLRESAGSGSQLNDIFREVERAYTGSYPVEFRLGRSDMGRQYFEAILKAASERDSLGILSAFLRSVGDTLVHQEQYTPALQRYATAWSANSEDFDAALATAYLLVEHAQDVDPDGSTLKQLITQLFEGKSRAYIGGDIEKIYRFHTILSSIFVRKGEWGSISKVDSAIFQLEYAIRAHSELSRRGDGKIEPIPILHRNLARAYRETNNPQKAYPKYLDAAAEALKTGNSNLARIALKEAEEISSGIAIRNRDRTRYEDLLKRL